MKRLTTNNLELRKCLYCEERNECYSKGWCSAVRKAIIELARYEKTGLIPEQIQELKEWDKSQPPIYQVQGDERYEQEPEWWMCPCCEEVYDMDDDYDFCPNCGQRLLR